MNGGYIYSIHGGYKLTYNWGGHPQNIFVRQLGWFEIPNFAGKKKGSEPPSSWIGLREDFIRKPPRDLNGQSMVSH